LGEGGIVAGFLLRLPNAIRTTPCLFDPSLFDPGGILSIQYILYFLPGTRFDGSRKVWTMGKGDMRTGRGKTSRGTFGKTRLKNPKQKKNKAAKKK